MFGPSLSKVRFISLFLGFLVFLFPVLNYAAAGCCSHHGGVKGCNTANNHQMCNDGSSSPTCLCNGGKTEKMKKNKNTMNSTTATTTTTTTATPATTMSTKNTKSKTTGCCSRHGGVASCDKASGYQMCKDGTRSSTCKC